MTISATKVHTLSTTKLEALRDQAEDAGNWPLFEACEEELERREDADSDPAYQAELQEAQDADAGLELGSYGS